MKITELRPITPPDCATSTYAYVAKSKKELNEKNFISLAMLNNAMERQQQPFVAHYRIVVEAQNELTRILESRHIQMQLHLKESLHSLKE